MSKIKGKQIADATISTANIIDSAITTAKLAGTITPAKLDLSQDFAFTGAVTAQEPTASNHVTTKNYVDGQLQGLDIKESVVATTTAILAVSASSSVNAGSGTITLADGDGGFNATADTFTVDGQSLSADDRVLIKDGININNGGADQTVNGIYTVGALNATTLVLTRASDSNTSAELSPGSFCFVEKGTTNGDSGFVATHDANPTLGTNNITYTQFSGGGSVTAGDGISKSGNTLSVDLDSNSGLAVGANGVKLDVSTLADASSVAVGSDTIVINASGTTKELSIVELVGSIKSSGLSAASGQLSANVAGPSGLELSGGAINVKLDSANTALSLSTAGLKVALHTEGSVDATSGGLRSPVASVISELSRNPSAVSSDDGDTGLTIGYTPAADSIVSVFVNGVRIQLSNGSGNESAGEGYFANPSAATTARSLSDIVANDKFIWNGSSAYALEASDVVDFVYETFK